MKAPEVRYARTDDAVHLAYQVLGEGPVDLLFLWGEFIPIDTMWEEPSLARCLRRLSGFGRLICFDRRGTGSSDPVVQQSSHTIERSMEDAITVLDAVGSTRAVVIAEADSGMVGMLLAASRPNHVAALVLITAWARFSWAADYPFGATVEDVDRFEQEGLDPNSAGTDKDPLAMVAPSVADDTTFREWWERAGRRGASPGVAKMLTRIAFEADVRSLLPSIEVPTLVLHRAGDRLIPIQHARYVAKHIPRARLVELDGDDSMFYVGDSDAVIDEIEEFVTGHRQGPRSDRVLATIVFTDIVGSTDRAAALGDRHWRDLLDRHDQLVRRQLERFRGREVSTAGDGFLVTFDGPGRAVQFASAIRDSVRAIELEVRVGVHIGEIEVRGDDIAGIAVHIAARVAGLAGPGEILVSSTVKDLVVGSGMEFEDRGEHQLKGVPSRWRLYSVLD